MLRMLPADIEATVPLRYTMRLDSPIISHALAALARWDFMLPLAGLAPLHRYELILRSSLLSHASVLLMLPHATRAPLFIRACFA